ncbi:4a-hydroxytetrahydrobiopterin dehydratase [Tessaracoccus lacteus]|uniref:Putative pterin-4-alpha-carbinolamine dehydratase n=1 Tax=Tessaracoccus lacteus TaxID=3041766 RepID=A0ABY8PY80_9ACTN|nr:4a-hydroxytetrahydrobiopterin dehydratase [Tessaracoccus sp. T21]WGT47367.1 4a-hydroxytetrahydrobiopterin dehydratase [Tessaracoccus sp. T21]
MSTQTLRVGDVDLADWRWMLEALYARFETGDFSAGAAFVAEVARIADELNHHPDVDLRYGHVQITSTSHDVGGVTDRDIELCRRISVVAEESGFAPRPDKLQALEVGLDTLDPDAIRPFWAAVLALGDADSDALVDPAGELPGLWFQDTTSTDPARMRFHFDITVPPDEAQKRVAAALKAGGRLVDTSHEPSWTILEDAEGNKVCVCSALGRDD